MGCLIYKQIGFYLSQKIIQSKIPNPRQTILYFQKCLVKRKKQFVWGGFMSRNCAGAVTNPKVSTMSRAYETRGPGLKRIKYKSNPQHDECPEGNAILVISDERHKIKVLLDSGSNIFLLNQNTARTLKVPYEIRENRLKITAFNGEVSSTGGKYYAHPIQLENRYQWTSNHGLLRDCRCRQI